MDDDFGLIFDAVEPADKPTDGFWNMREITIYAIDCTKSMFAPGPDGEPYFRKSINCLKSVYMNKIIGTSKDAIGIVFFGTKVDDPSHSHKHIRTFWEPKEADADIVKQLENTLNSETYCDFADVYGHSDDYALADVLWHASSLISRSPVKAHFKQVVLMTVNDNPHSDLPTKQYQARKKAEDLQSLGIRLEVTPLRSGFNGDLFYKEVLEIVNQEEYDFSVSESVVHEMLTRVYRKDSKKRSVSKLTFAIGDEIRFSVDVYNFYRRLAIPPRVKLDRETNEVVKSIVQTYDAETGTRLLKSDLSKGMNVCGGAYVSFESDEVKKLVEADKTGITLLGFKSLGYLSVEHHFKPASFLYPSESVVRGSKTLFAALVDGCARKGKFALCHMVARSGGEASLVALVPQRERLADGVQVMPAGFHVIFLPYADNIRQVPLEAKVRVTPEQLDVCRTLVNLLAADYQVQQLENPKIQTHWANIEALALEHDVRAVVDGISPNYVRVSEDVGSLERQFVETFFPPDYDPETASKAKRKYPAYSESKAKMQKFDQADPQYVEKMVRAGCGDKLTVPILKNYLIKNDFNVSGFKKQDLLNYLYGFLNYVVE